MLLRILMFVVALAVALHHPSAGFAAGSDNATDPPHQGDASETARHARTIARVLDLHVVPGFAGFVEQSAILQDLGRDDCTTALPELRAQYHAVFRAWMGVSHLRFGPTERDDRAFAIAFWPDTKGFTPKSLRALIASQDPAVWDPKAFATVSIAARGLFALEFLLFDAEFLPNQSLPPQELKPQELPSRAVPGETATDHLSNGPQGAAQYTCALIQAIARDIHQNAVAIQRDWVSHEVSLMRDPTPDGPYRSQTEAVQELYKALLAGLQFTADARMGRPLGSFDHPRPKRAEAWRSQRSLTNVIQTLTAMQEMAALLAQDHPDTAANLANLFASTIDRAKALKDPVFAGVSAPRSRLRVDILRQGIALVRETAIADLGPKLGVAVGFNALDGD